MEVADLARRMRDVSFGLGLCSFMEEIGIGAAVLDRSLRFLAANGAMATISALPADGYVGRSLEELIPASRP